MSLSERQLATWAKPQTGLSANKTHKAIRAALAAADAPSGYRWEVTLQGSYRNSTNTRGNHDVDVVVELVSHAETEGSTGSWFQLRPFYAFVSRALKERFGRGAVTERSKCLRVEGRKGYVDADVVVAITHHVRVGRNLIPGIRLYTGLVGEHVVNFPRLHYANGAEKNKATGGRYRRTVRMFKNARNHIGRKAWFPPDVPSYFLECLLYNVPDECFDASLQTTYLNATAALLDAFTKHDDETFMCQNGVQELFGAASTQWNERDAWRCVEGFYKLWM